MLAHYIEIGAVSVEGVDKDGEIMYAITESAKEIAPELWEAHVQFVDETLLNLYEKGLIEVEYDENLDAYIHMSEKGYEIAREYGLIEPE